MPRDDLGYPLLEDEGYRANSASFVDTLTGPLALTGGTVTTVFIVFVILLTLALWIRFTFLRPRRRPQRSEHNELGSADLANKNILKRWFKGGGPLDTLLYVKDIVGSEGIIKRSGSIVLPVEERNRHVLIIARTGSGKTSRLILPVLYQDCLCPIRSTIVIDAKPEMWPKLSMLTRELNPKKRLLLFNPLDRARSLSWNILAKVHDDTDAKLIANSIIMATDNPSARSETPFFRNNALQLLYSIMIGLLFDPNERLSMPRIHELVHSGVKNLCDWLEAHPEAIRNARTFVDLVRSGSQNADTLMSELSMRLSAWDLQAIRSTTFKNELDLDCLIHEPTLLVVELRESEIEMLRPLGNVIVVELLRFLTKRAESMPGQRLSRPVSIVIDEFASALGRLPDIHVKLNTLRSRNVSIVGAIQSIAQIKANYGTDADSVIAGFNTKILIPTLDYLDAEWASKESGTMTVRYSTASRGKSKKLLEGFANRNIGFQEQVQQRPVLTPAEIGSPGDNTSTIFLPNTPVFQGHLIPFFEIPEMMKNLAKYNGQEVALRTEPLHYTDTATAVPTLTGDSTRSLEEELERLKEEAGFAHTIGYAREWWVKFEEANPGNAPLLTSLIREILARNGTIAEFFLAYVATENDNILINLEYLESVPKEERIRKSVQLGYIDPMSVAPEFRAAELPVSGDSIPGGLPSEAPPISEPPVIQTPPPAIPANEPHPAHPHHDSSSEASEASRLLRLSFDTAPALARSWWREVEARNATAPQKLEALVACAEELHCGLSELFLAYLVSKSDALADIRTNLTLVQREQDILKRSLSREEATQMGTLSLLQQIEGLKIALGWNSTSPEAQQWWGEFEVAQANSLDALYSLLKELHRKGVSLEQHFHRETR